MSRLSLQVFYLWRHVSSTAPSFILQYSMVVKFRHTTCPPPPQLSLNTRAALSSNSNGTQSVYNRKNPKSSLYCEMSMYLTQQSPVRDVHTLWKTFSNTTKKCQWVLQKRDYITNVLIPLICITGYRSVEISWASTMGMQERLQQPPVVKIRTTSLSSWIDLCFLAKLKGGRLNRNQDLAVKIGSSVSSNQC
jgi:hypothetical protein